MGQVSSCFSKQFQTIDIYLKMSVHFRHRTAMKSRDVLQANSTRSSLLLNSWRGITPKMMKGVLGERNHVSPPCTRTNFVLDCREEEADRPPTA